MLITQLPDMAALFDQLGLDSSPESIETFFARHQLASSEDVSDADFLSFEQRLTLTRLRDEGPAWAELVDAMEARLHRA